MRVQIEDFQIMRPRGIRPMKLFGVKICQCQMDHGEARGRFVRIAGDQSLQLLRRVLDISGLFECEGKIEPRAE